LKSAWDCTVKSAKVLTMNQVLIGLHCEVRLEQIFRFKCMLYEFKVDNLFYAFLFKPEYILSRIAKPRPLFTCVSYRADCIALISIPPRGIVQKIITENLIVACNSHITQKLLAEFTH
jgi:hypothetical protein